MFRLETARLHVRPWEQGDRAAFVRMVADREMMRFISGDKVWSDADVDGFFRRQQANLAAHGACMAAMCLRETGEVMGIAGAQKLDRMDIWDVGWWTWRDYWGQGYATEAAHELVRYVLGTRGEPEVYAIIEPANIASVRVAEKIGMRLVGESTGDQTASWRAAVPVSVYRRDASPR